MDFVGEDGELGFVFEGVEGVEGVGGSAGFPPKRAGRTQHRRLQIGWGLSGGGDDCADCADGLDGWKCVSGAFDRGQAF
ncbi:hypothetical protein CCHR01_19014 [Colletotrichum chrysophilum]|uniref:Uncharacterized protein n=1 Tax=Colletotrichum chrysophilum TaxID=1836956 RepID=A0AAD8ZZ91_9PEZI|nr:hypothetical protein CCHR01_19014 [Colletotrichum chrysophilum]